MEFRPTSLERAFELARSGDCADVTALKKQLIAEGHTPAQISGPTILRQLRGLIAARGKADA